MANRIWRVLCKLIQRQTYSCLSTNYGLWCLFAGLVIIVVTVFHFGEVALQWSMVNYAEHFKIVKHYNNIAGKSYEDRLCLPQPIDVVYTWVNGSDILLINQLHEAKEKLKKELNATGRLYRPKKSREKLIDSENFKWKDNSLCPLPNCVPAHQVVMSGFTKSMTLTQLKVLNSNLSSALKIEFWVEDLELAFITFPSREKINSVLQSSIIYNKKKVNMSEVFYTSSIKPGYKRIKTSLMMYDILKEDTQPILKALIETDHPKSVSKINVYNEAELAVVHFTGVPFVTLLHGLSKNNLTIHNRRIRLFPVTYVWKPITLSHDTIDEDVSSNRFADNEELRYSLRSIEKFAPWVRKIFIVTNGQIPNWLNLDHPRITLVTHEEIFINKSHLPTFSSPAIESHIHRIPGLSKKFIYMNDDVFFGDYVWPDDFYTHSNGQKVYLTWSVPNCNEGCPSSWLNDKYCDKACNVSACDWDGGDCLGNKSKSMWNLALMAQSGLYQHNLGEYCSSGCAHNWIGDRYCDGNCNVPSCGFDAGDCGLTHHDQLYSIAFNNTIFKQKHINIFIPRGTLAMFVNFTGVFKWIKDGNYNDQPVVRSAVFSRKHNIFSLTFYKNFTTTNIQFQVLGHLTANGTDKTVLVFNLTVNTMPIQKKIFPGKLLHGETSTPNPTPTASNIPQRVYKEDGFQVENLISAKDRMEEVLNYPKDLLNMSLPIELKKRLEALESEFDTGLLTQRGYNKSKSRIYQEYVSLKNKEPVRKLLSIDLERALTDRYTTLFSDHPWERAKTHFLDDINNLFKRKTLRQKYQINNSKSSRRHLLDAFSSSLLHVSSVYNKAFGYLSRKVPAHMPHMVDRDIVFEMQEKFPKEFDATSSHNIRHPRDMQFAFAFNYFVIGLKEVTNLTSLFDRVDTDKSGILSDRELRSLAALIYELPLSLKKIKDLENKFTNCSKRVKSMQSKKLAEKETYYNKNLPLVTRNLFLNCHEVWRSANVTQKNKYKHEIVGQDDVTFKMIRNNISYVMYQLDWIRKNPKKFTCLNDDLDHAREDTKTIRTILRDFYESLFPIPSQFELRKNYKNRFLYKRDLDEWIASQRYRAQEKNLLILCVVLVLVLLLFRAKFLFLLRRWRVSFRRPNARNMRDI